jgi:hypothetical protein
MLWWQDGFDDRARHVKYLLERMKNLDPSITKACAT